MRSLKTTNPSNWPSMLRITMVPLAPLPQLACQGNQKRFETRNQQRKYHQKYAKAHNYQFNYTDLIKKISAWLPCHDMGLQPSPGLDPGLLASLGLMRMILLRIAISNCWSTIDPLWGHYEHWALIQQKCGCLTLRHTSVAQRSWGSGGPGAGGSTLGVDAKEIEGW